MKNLIVLIFIGIICMMFLVPEKPVQTLPPCPKCNEVGCIYEEIDDMSDGTDASIFNAILKVSHERNLSGQQVEYLLKEYHL